MTTVKTKVINAYCYEDLAYPQNPYCIKLIYGQDFISEQIEFKATLNNFVTKYQFSGGVKSSFVSTLDLDTYCLNFSTAYCVNANQTVTATRELEEGKIPYVEWQLDEDFADGNEIIIKTEKYFYILFSKDVSYLSGNDRVPEISIEIYGSEIPNTFVPNATNDWPASSKTSLSSTTLSSKTYIPTTDTSINVNKDYYIAVDDDSDGNYDYVKVENPVFANISSYLESETVDIVYLYAYVRAGDIVKIHAEEGKDEESLGIKKSPVLFYYDVDEFMHDLRNPTFKQFTDAQIATIKGSNVYQALTNATDGEFVNSKDAVVELIDAAGLKQVSAHLTESSSTYIYHPQSNRFYLADYYGLEETVGTVKLVGILAPGNSSYYKMSDGSTPFAQSYKNGFNFIINKSEYEGSVSFDNKYHDNEDSALTDSIMYSQFELYEENKQLYTVKDAKDQTADRLNALTFVEFSNSKITYYLYGPENTTQYVLLVKSTLKYNGVNTGYYKITTLPSQTSGTVIDYVYKAETSQFVLQTGTPNFNASNVYYTIGMNGTLEETTSSSSPIFFKKEAVNKVLHGMTMRYDGKNYTFINGNIYKNYSADGSGNMLSETYNPAIDGFFFNVDYINYEVKVYKLRYSFGVNATTQYTFENGVLKNSSGTPVTNYEITDNGGLKLLDPTGTYLDVIGYSITNKNNPVVCSLKETENLEEGDNFTAKRITVSIYDSKYTKLTHDTTTSKLVELEDGQNVNSLIEINFTADSRKKTNYFKYTDEHDVVTTYYILGVNLYHDAVCTKPVDSSINDLFDITYEFIEINGSSYKLNASEESYAINGGTVYYNRADGKVYLTKDGETFEDPVEFEYTLTAPNVIEINDADDDSDDETYATVEEELKSDTVKILNNTYYIANNLLFINYPYSVDTQVDTTTDIVDNLFIPEKEYAKYVLSEYYIYPDYISHNDVIYSKETLTKEAGNVGTMSYKNSENEVIVYDIATDTVSKDGTTLSSSTYKYSNNKEIVYKAYTTATILKLSNTITYGGADYNLDTTAEIPYQIELNGEPFETTDTYVKYVTEEGDVVYFNCTTNKLRDVSNGDDGEELFDVSSKQYILSNEKTYYCRAREADSSDSTLISSKEFVGDEIALTATGKISTNYTTSRLESITAKAYNGYYIKGFIIENDFDSIKQGIKLHYVVGEINNKLLTGLQNSDYYSNLNFRQFIPIEYSVFKNVEAYGPFRVTKGADGNITSITYNFDMQIYGSTNIYVVYAPVIYSIKVKQVNLQDVMTDSSVEMTDIYDNYFTSREFESSTVGYIKGQLLAEYEGDVWLKARAYNGNMFIGYSLGKKTNMKEIDTVFNGNYLTPSTTIDDVKTAITDTSTDTPFYRDNEEKGHSFANLKFITGSSPATANGQIYFMDKDIMQYANGTVTVNENEVGGSNNNIFLLKITNNVELYTYYKAVQYTLEINLGEMNNGYYTNYENDSLSGENSYLSYSDSYVTLQKPWSNPAQTLTTPIYHYTVNDGRLVDDSSLITYKGVVSNSTMVYTLYDNFGNLIKTDEYGSQIATPTEILSNTINFELSRKFGFLVYNKVNSLFSDYKYFVPSIEAVTYDMEDGYQYGASQFKTSTGITYSVEQVTATSNRENVTFDVIKNSSGEVSWVILKTRIYFGVGLDSKKDVKTAVWLEKTVNNVETKYYQDVYKMYKVIPYTVLENYLEYTSDYIESTDFGNKSQTLGIEDSIYIPSEKLESSTVSSNNKYVYSIFTIIQEDIYDITGELQSTENKIVLSESNKVFHVTTDEVDISTYSYVTFNKPVTVDGVEYTFAVFASYGDSENEIFKDGFDFETHWQMLTTDYIDNLLYQYQATGGEASPYAEKVKMLEKMGIIYTSQVDKNVYNNEAYNISSSAINYVIKNYDTYLTQVVDGNLVYSQLNPYLFQICIGGEYYINSQDFNNKPTNKAIISPVSAISGTSKDFVAKLDVNYTNDGEGERYATIKITLKIVYDENGSLPSITITASDDRNAYINSATNTAITSYKKDPNVSVVGKGIDYTHNTNRDTIYKPTGNEIYGTNSSTPVQDDIIDTSFMTTNSSIHGYFSNIYALSNDNFELPNLNVNAKLIYKQAIKKVNTTMTFTAEGENGTAYEMLSKNGVNMFRNSDGSFTGQSGLLYNLYDNSILKANPSTSAPRTELSSYAENGYIIEHYYLYIISDAYYVLDLLQKIYNSSSDTDTKYTAMNYINYITGFNPENYGVDGKNCPRYVFSDKAQYQYKDLYDFISQHIHNNLAKPAGKVTSYLKIRIVDIFSAAKDCIDANFVKSYFTQKDLVISSVQIKKMFQVQIMKPDKVFGFPNWYGYKAYNYYLYASNNISCNLETDSFVWSGAPAHTILYCTDAEYMGTGGDTNEGRIQKVYNGTQSGDTSVLKKFISAYRLRYNDLYFNLIDASMCLTPENFANASGSDGSAVITAINTNVIIDNDRDSKNRIKMEQYDFNPVPGGQIASGILAAVAVVAAVAAHFTPIGWAGDLLMGISYAAIAGVAFNEIFMTGCQNIAAAVQALTELYQMAFSKNDDGTIEFKGLTEADLKDKITSQVLAG